MALGVTAENQEWADKRIPYLLRAPARFRFVSIEPMVGAVDLEMVHIGLSHPLNPAYCPGHVNALAGRFTAATGDPGLDHRNSMDIHDEIWLHTHAATPMRVLRPSQNDSLRHPGCSPGRHPTTSQPAHTPSVTTIGHLHRLPNFHGCAVNTNRSLSRVAEIWPSERAAPRDVSPPVPDARMRQRAVSGGLW